MNPASEFFFALEPREECTDTGFVHLTNLAYTTALAWDPGRVLQVGGHVRSRERSVACGPSHVESARGLCSTSHLLLTFIGDWYPSSTCPETPGAMFKTKVHTHIDRA